MNAKRWFVRILILCQLFSCSSQKTVTSLDLFPDGVAKVERDELKDLDSIVVYGYSKIAKDFGLSDLWKGVKGQEVRLWIMYPAEFKGSLTVITNDQQGWRSEAYFFTIYAKKDQPDSIPFKKESNEPSNSWSKVLSQLNDAEIGKLADYRKIPNYKIDMGFGGAVYIEYADKDRCRFVELASYQSQKGEPELEKYKKVFSIITKEFGYRILQGPFN